MKPVAQPLGCILVFAFTLSAQTPVFTYRIVHTYHHDPAAFTQGLEYRDGYLYEGTGLVGKSQVRKVKLETGQVLEKIDIPSNMFGEGITVLGNRILELTWQHHIGFVRDRATFREEKRFNYPGEGWGLANDGKRVFMSDGSAQIRIWDPETLAEKERITVRDQGRPIDNLNELEWVRDELYANIWQTDRIARISPNDGRVIAWIDCSGLLTEAERENTDVLNGIAYDAAHNRLFVTGKQWPKLFEIELVPRMKLR
ncbi:MAG TPA: glutaminyl-peptide cyclotransferase [Bryobacteraceae bacterium]|nr:glutaminyl-peptide cyclotransferase [Bryobacteraceae bacterium]